MVKKDEWYTKEGMVSQWRMHRMNSGMAKGTSQAEAMLNSDKIKPVALAIAELHDSEGIRQAGRLAGRQAVNQLVENFI